MPEPQEASTDKLPTQEIYAELDKDEQCKGAHRTHGCCTHMKNDLYKALKKFQYSSHYANLIAENWCCANIMRINHVPKEEDRCNSLYFWIGSKIKEKLEHHSFDAAIKTVCNRLKQFHCNSECKNLYPDISWDMFEKRKIVFDYCYDHSRIEQQLKIPNNSHHDAYCTHVKNANKAFAAVQQDCDGVGSKSKYCREFKKDCEYSTPQMLINSHCGSLYGARTSLGATEAEGTLQKVHLEVLPSYSKYYRRFRDGLAYCTYDCFPKKKIWNRIKEHFNDEKYANIIARALCYVYTRRRDDEEFDNALCKIFNFWLQDKFSKKLKGETTFFTLVGVINKELRSINAEHKCTLTDFSTNTTTTTTTNNVSFEHRKTLFEFFIDYEKIMKPFGAPMTSDMKCDKKYKKHLEDIVDAYNAVHAKCGTADKQCYNEFKDLFTKVGSSNGTLTLECQKLSPEEEAKLNEDRGSQEDEFPSSAFNDLPDDQIEGCTEELNRASNTYGAEIKSEARAKATSTSTANAALPTAVSSGLAVVGLPTILYLLYKYNLLPSWIGKHFGGRSRRGKKKRFINHDLNIFLDNNSTEISSTEGTSTLVGSTTMDDDDSTDSTTLYSVPYIR